MLKVKKLHEDAILPKRATPLSAGLDLYCVGHYTIFPNARALIPTGIAVELPTGCYGRIAPRSGLATRYGINVHAGVIDADYRGMVHVALINHGPDLVEIRKGERIAQLILEVCLQDEAEWVEELSDTERLGGFGSTGR